MCCTRLAGNAGRKKSPSAHHRTTLSGYIFGTKACINNRKKLVKQQYLLHMFTPANMVNFGLLTAEICWRVWGTPTNFNGFRVLAALLHRSSSGCQPNFAAFNRGRHLCSAGRPSYWALAHISSLYVNWTINAKLYLPPPKELCSWLPSFSLMPI